MNSDTLVPLDPDRIYKPYPSLGHLYEQYNKSASISNPEIIEELKKYKIYSVNSSFKIIKDYSNFKLIIPSYSAIEQSFDVTSKPDIMSSNNYIVALDSPPSLFSIYCLKEFALYQKINSEKINSWQKILLSNLLNIDNILYRNYVNTVLDINFNPDKEKEELFLNNIKRLSPPLTHHLLTDCVAVLQTDSYKEFKPLAARIIESIDISNFPNLYYIDNKYSFLSLMGNIFGVYFDGFNNIDSSFNKSEKPLKFAYNFFETDSNFEVIISKPLLYKLNQVTNSENMRMAELSDPFITAQLAPQEKVGPFKSLWKLAKVIPSVATAAIGNKFVPLLEQMKISFILSGLNLSNPAGQPSYEKLINHVLLSNLSFFSYSYQEKILANAQDFLSSSLAKNFLEKNVSIKANVLALMEKKSLQSALSPVSPPVFTEQKSKYNKI